MAVGPAPLPLSRGEACPVVDDLELRQPVVARDADGHLRSAGVPRTRRGPPPCRAVEQALHVVGERLSGDVDRGLHVVGRERRDDVCEGRLEPGGLEAGRMDLDQRRAESPHRIAYRARSLSNRRAHLSGDWASGCSRPS